MELILFNKYLVRGYEGGFILQKVKDGKKAIAFDNHKEDSKGLTYIYRDFSNFGKETYPSTIESVLANIRQQEITDSEVKTIEELSKLLLEIKQIELDILKKFK